MEKDNRFSPVAQVSEVVSQIQLIAKEATDPLEPYDPLSARLVFVRESGSLKAVLMTRRDEETGKMSEGLTIVAIDELKVKNARSMAEEVVSKMRESYSNSNLGDALIKFVAGKAAEYINSQSHTIYLVAYPPRE